jgi:glyoxylase-like metal-dependent hydrolase (beta-lactamase superfamily II)
LDISSETFGYCLRFALKQWSLLDSGKDDFECDDLGAVVEGRVMGHEFGFSRRSLLSGAGIAVAATAVPGIGRALGVESVQAVKPGAFYKSKVGSLEIFVLADGQFQLPLELIAMGVSPSEAEPLLKKAHHPSNPLIAGSSVLAIRRGETLTLIDSGAGPAAGATGGWLLHSMSLAGLDPSSVSHILLTHAHGDHMGGLSQFPKATVHVNAAERDFWNREDLTWEAASGMGKEAGEQGIAAAREVFRKFKMESFTPGKELLPGITPMAATGHTPGHVSVVVSDGGDTLHHIVDSAHHVIAHLQRPDWSSAFDVDAATARATRRKLLDSIAADKVRLCAAHFPFPGLGYVEKEAEGWRFTAEPYRFTD